MDVIFFIKLKTQNTIFQGIQNRNNHQMSSAS